MKIIWKFSLAETIEMPEDAEILTLQVQSGIPCLWALVEDTHLKEVRRFSVEGTGWEVVNSEDKKYIGTYQESGGNLIWHVFEILKGGQ